MMKILTFDIEEWYIEKHFNGNRKDKYKKFDETLDWILASLETRNLKSTFFCVGELATEFPEIINKISKAGHEIGCHSNRHFWINKMTRKEFEEDTRIALEQIEDLIGRKIRSYRAPAFSIGQNNTWAFEILAKYGIENDCSVFPISRDFGGFPQFSSSLPTIVTQKEYILKEFPINTARILSRDIAFSGGGYFRLIPYSIQEYLLRGMDYVMFYFHINDLIKEKSKLMSKNEYEKYFKEPGTIKNRWTRYLKSNIGRSGSQQKLEKLLDKYSFINVEDASKQIAWNNQPHLFL